jgi:hypothetical protein
VNSPISGLPTTRVELPSLAADANFADKSAHFLAFIQDRLGSFVRRPPSTTWREISRFHYLSDDEIIESLQTDAKLHRAIQLDNTTRFLVISIPFSSPYHNSDDLICLRRSLNTWSIKTVTYQSDDDWHLYIFFDRPVSVNTCSDLIDRWSRTSGFILSDHTLQFLTVVPLPLQAGFSWLDDLGQVTMKREALTIDQALQHFLADTIMFSNDAQTIAATFDQAEDYLQEQQLPAENNCPATSKASTTDGAVPEDPAFLFDMESTVDLSDQTGFRNSASLTFQNPPNTNVCEDDYRCPFPEPPSSDLPGAPNTDQSSKPNNSEQDTPLQHASQILLFPIPRSTSAAFLQNSKPRQCSAIASILERPPPDT